MFQVILCSLKKCIHAIFLFLHYYFQRIYITSLLPCQRRLFNIMWEVCNICARALLLPPAVCTLTCARCRMYGSHSGHMATPAKYSLPAQQHAGIRVSSWTQNPHHVTPPPPPLYAVLSSARAFTSFTESNSVCCSPRTSPHNHVKSTVCSRVTVIN